MLRRDTIQILPNTLNGRFILPCNRNHNDPCGLRNAMIDRLSAVIVRPAGAADVDAAVGFACRHGIEIAVKGGGHRVGGNGFCDSGLTLDVSGIKSFPVTPSDRPAQVDEIEKHRGIEKPVKSHPQRSECKGDNHGQCNCQ